MTIREHVRLNGFLAGQGHEAKCMVLATKVTLEPHGPSKVIGHTIRGMSEVLPEGDYQLAVSNGEVIPVRYHGGHWLSRGP
jgi:hypothetical protein